MIEVNDNVALIVEQQVSDVQAAQEQYKAIAEGREVHPQELARLAETSEPLPLDAPQVAAQTLQPVTPLPPPDPAATMRHLRLTILVLLGLMLVLLWMRQRRQGRA